MEENTKENNTELFDQIIMRYKKEEARAILLVKKTLNELEKEEPVFLVVYAISGWSPKRETDAMFSLGGRETVEVLGVMPSPAKEHVISKLEEIIQKIKDNDGTAKT